MDLKQNNYIFLVVVGFGVEEHKEIVLLSGALQFVQVCTNGSNNYLHGFIDYSCMI